MSTKDEPIHAIAREIAKRLGPSWKYESKWEQQQAHVVCTDGRELSVTRPFREERVCVRACGWPSYREIRRDWRSAEATKVDVTPRNLYNPDAQTPEATMALGRGMDAIAREVARRIMEPYSLIWGRCVAQAAKRQQAEDAKNAAWERVCEVLGADPNKPTASFIGSFDVRPNSANDVYCDRGGSIDVEEAIVAIKAVKAYRAANGRKSEAS